MNHYSDSNLLDVTLTLLGGKEDHETIRAASDIKGHVEAAARELSLERFSNFESELYQKIFSLVHDESLAVKRGGILAIRELIDCTSAAAESKVIKFANTIAAVLKANTDFSLIELVADCLGYMARHSPVSHVDYVESELNRALEWLHGTQPHRLFAACVVLQQLADNAPTIFFVRTREFFDLIWGPLWHSKEFIRLSAGKALSACLAVLGQRTYHLQWYCNIYDMIHEGFQKGTAESIHGSLLVVREMLKHTGNFMMPRFKEVCKAIMLLKDHNSKVVTSAITSLLPSLALFCPDAFARRHLNESVDLLVKCASIPQLRPQALLSTGRLCKALGPHLVCRIDEVIVVVQAALIEGSNSKKIRYEVAPEALQCVSDMVLGLGGPFHDRVVSLLEPMLQGGLTSELINTLTVIATHMPYQRPVVQQRLLEESTKLLGGIPKQIIPQPEYVYCWARKGVRSSISRRKIYGLREWGTDNNTEILTKMTSSVSTALLSHSVSTAVLPSVASISSGMGLTVNGKNISRPYRVTSGMFIQQPLTGVANNAIYCAPDQRISPLITYRKRLPPTAAAFIQTSACGSMSTSLPGPPIVPISGGGGFFSNLISAPVALTATTDHSVKCSPDTVLLSLRTLGSLSPPATTLLHLIQESVLPYTNADDISVRKEAAITCAKMLVSSGRSLKSRGPTSTAVEEIISRLLELVVTDPAHIVRLAVLKCLTYDFNLSLRRAQHIETLLFLLSDENFEIKMQTLTILGRLGHLNPAAVLPPLRQLLMRLISEIRGSADDRSKEEAALMICNFLRASPLHSIVKPFVGTLIRTLPLNADIRLTTASLEAVGELCMVVRDDILPYGDQLLPQIITSMYDNSSKRKQEMAVKTLGQLVSATGQVVKPYLQYPQLLPRALDLLFKNASTTPWTLRMQVLRTVGLLGALEPYKYSLIVTHLQNYEKLNSNRKSSGSGSGSDNGLDFKGDLAGPAVSFLGTVSTSGMYDFRDRADSNTSTVNVHPNQLNSRDNYGEKERDAGGGLGGTGNGKGQKREELIHSEVLLDDDTAEAPAHLFMYEQSVMRSLSEPIVKEEIRRTPTSEDYYPRIAVTALMKILKDSSLSVHHSSVTQAIMFIFKSLGIRCVPFLDQIVPYLLQVARKCGPGLRESLLQQLALLTSIVHHNISPFLPALFDIIRDYWSEHQEHILILVEELAATATDAFGNYIPIVLPLLLSSLSVPKGISAATMVKNDFITPPLASLEQTLHCYNSLRGILRPHIHLIVPVICKLISQLQDIGTQTVPWQAKAVATLRRICTSARGSVVEQSLIVVSRTVHCLTRTVTIAHEGFVSPQSLIYDECIATLCALGNQMGPRFITFDSLITRSIEGKGLNSGSYRQLSSNLRSGFISEFRYEDLDLGGSFDGEGGYGMSNIRGSESDLVGIGAVHSQWPLTRNDTSALSVGAILHSSPGHALSANSNITYYGNNNAQNNTSASLLHGQQSGGMQKPLPLNQQQLSRAWDVSQRSTAADWNEWLRRLNVDLLKESPSPALRSCSALAQAYTPLARDLFHAAFVSCWHELSEQYQDSLVRALQTAFRSNSIPPEILQTLLNLAEFMEHDVEALPISLSILAELAQKGHAYAKALHYRELEFQTSPATCFESLININKKLDQYDAAIGVLKVVGQMQKKHPELKETYKVQEAWLAKLGHWGEALRMYDARLMVTPRDGMAIAGKLKCLDALGRWEEAIKLCIDNLNHLRSEGSPSGNAIHTSAAVIGARAAWSLNGWGLMDNIVSQLPPDNIDASFMRAVLAVHKENYEEAAVLIEQTRKHLDGGIRALLAESYGRAYVPLIMAQQCSELEEITEYKMLLREAGMSTPIAPIDFLTGDSSHLNATGNNNNNNNNNNNSNYGNNNGVFNNDNKNNNNNNNNNDDNNNNNNNNNTNNNNNSNNNNNNNGRKAGSSGDVSRRNSNASLLNMNQNGSVLTEEVSGMNGRGPISRITSSVPRSARMHSMPVRHLYNSPPSSMNGRSESLGSCMSSPSGYQSGYQETETVFNPNDANIQALRLEVVKRKAHLAEKWRQRIRGCCSSGRAAIPVWKYLLNGRRMVLSEREDLDTWLEFASLCRNGGNTALAERVLNMSQRPAINSPAGSNNHNNNNNNNNMSDEANASMDRRVKFALLKQQWAVSDRKPALNGLDALIRSASNGWESMGRTVNSSSSGSSLAQIDSAVYLECLLKLGEWKIAMVDPGEVVDRSTRREVLALYGRATLVDSQSYRAWHQWGLSNYRAIEEARGSTGRIQSNGIVPPTPRDRDSAPKPSPRIDYKLLSPRDRKGSITRGQMQPSLVSLSQEVVIPLAVNAAKGLLRAISLGTRKHSSSVAQDMLCLLSVWFRYGKIPEICSAIEAGLATVHLDNWLGVLPQLIARIDHPEQNARRVLHDLLGRLGQRHAQALVYPLSVALKSPKGNRKEAAEILMASLRQHSAKLIDQALLVSQELVRVAILWQEVWHECLEEASRQYFGDGNIQAMLDTLVPLHVALKEGPTTLREAAFCQAYATDLHEAFEYISAYKQFMADTNQTIPQSGAAPSAKRSAARTPSRPGASGQDQQGNHMGREESYLQQAWDLYYTVFKRINAELPQVTMLELHNCSPALLHCRDLDLGVPGTYAVSGSAVRIKNFGPNVAIIRSKQRPRKIKIYGDDGREFVFLLKGHEDLRQDERAMQLFGLVNALLYYNRSTGSESHDLSIQRYAVVPLSPTAGLISWVPNCDTLHDLIRDFRESRKIMLNVEHKLMQQIAPNQTYEALPHAHKLEIFEHALANTAGEDLAKILWLKSDTSETWLQRRANYTRSLAVMSMVGYVLGLGDRHPSNLMLDRKSGKVLHIDFGDCFEVAMQREKFPERVPFRLTRMLVNAMEVSGIEGNYRLTCEKVMCVLRENNDSLVATLEAFVHDPLISWRLLNIDRRKDRKGPEGRAATGTKPVKSVTITPKAEPASAVAAVPGTGTMTGTNVILKPNSIDENTNSNINSNSNTKSNHAIPYGMTPSTDSMRKVEVVNTTEGAERREVSERDREREREKEREGVEVRDLTAVFASCNTNVVQPSVTIPTQIAGGGNVKARPRNVPILSFTPFLAQDVPPSAATPTPATPSVKVQTNIKVIESSSCRVQDTVLSPTSVAHPTPIPLLPLLPLSPTPPVLPLPLPTLSGLLPVPSPAYPSCFVGSIRRGSMTRYTQLCNKMEPLIENVLERMDSTGNLLDLDGDISIKRASMVKKLKRFNKIDDKDGSDEEKDEKVLNISSLEIIVGLSIENNVEGGVPFSSPVKKIIDNDINDYDTYTVNPMKLRDEIILSNNVNNCYTVNTNIKEDKTISSNKMKSMIADVNVNKVVEASSTKISNKELFLGNGQEIIMKKDKDNENENEDNEILNTTEIVRNKTKINSQEKLPLNLKSENEPESNSTSCSHIGFVNEVRTTTEVDNMKDVMQLSIKSEEGVTSVVKMKTLTSPVETSMNGEKYSSKEINSDNLSDHLPSSHPALGSYIDLVSIMNSKNITVNHIDISLPSQQNVLSRNEDNFHPNSVIEGCETVNLEKSEMSSKVVGETIDTRSDKEVINCNGNDTNGNSNGNDTNGNSNGNDTNGNSNGNDTNGNSNGNDTNGNSNGRHDIEEHSSNLSDVLVSATILSSSSTASSSVVLNSGSSFKQLQYQLRQQRHQQQYQVQEPELDSTQSNINMTGGLSSYRPNLHLEMSSLANSVSLHSPPQTSYSLAHMRMRELSLAQAKVENNIKDDNNQITQILPEVEYDDSDAQQELLTDKAVTVIRRVMDKLSGLDFYDPASLAAPTALDVPEQVDRLIIQASAHENLCLSFLGWCPFW